MALLDEEIVEYWLNNNGFFCMRGVKTGLGEIDFLASRPNKTGLDCWHVEVTVSFRPIGYIGGNTNARRRTNEEISQGVDDWIQKKFLENRKLEKRDLMVSDANWDFVLICAEVKHSIELDMLESRGIKIYRYKDILNDLIGSHSYVNSTAGNIIEILRYMNKI